MNHRASLQAILLTLVPLLLPNVAAAQAPRTTTVEFNRDIRPILADNCFVCHGPDKNLRKAKLRLDLEEEAFADRGGYRVLVPGKPAESELYRRISTKDVKEQMPPAKHPRHLAPRQVELVRRWIEQGAKWQPHWSLIAPKRIALPRVADSKWPINPVDYFILAKLDDEKLHPTPEADRRTLLRRLSFDLTGLPPTPGEVDGFLADTSPKAYEKAVDRLLASPHYGERLAQYWLDVVRYSDTAGYHSDNHRDVYLYRDWVIDAFNKNLSFDRFTVEQLGGDLLPNPTAAQKIASGYNRLLQTTEEGGAQPKEYLAKYAADRVRNTATIFLGLTMGCCECHNHKFDPLTTKEFYSFAAFFADLKEKAVGRQEQTPLPTPAQAADLQRLDEQLAPLQKTLTAPNAALDAAQAQWEATLRGKKSKGLPKEVIVALGVEPAKRNAKQKQALTIYYRSIAPPLREVSKQIADLQRRKAAIAKAIPTTLVSTAVPPRTMRVLPRGNWLDDSGQVVEPAVPAVLNPLGVKGRRATRLDLGKWLAAPENPLTARVFVNRLWKLFFGQGLVRTLDDFGAQGGWPTHPELLNWLAVEFRESGWDVKHTVKLIVMSRAYRQSSRVSEELKHRDPFNYYVARQGRWRLDAEMVRDNALAVSGLLSRKVGGPSVKPYQPAGYWAALNFPKREWMKDRGEEVYRRGLYTYWCRTFLQPSMLAFDASTREECTVERPRSNIPQQALVLLNDPTYVEAARTLAERILERGGASTEAHIQFAFRAVLGRKAQPAEVKVLAALQEQQLRDYLADRKAAEALLRVGDRPPPQGRSAPEVAAWTSVARVVLNLHETITRD